MSKRIHFLQSVKDFDRFTDFLSYNVAKVYSFHVQELAIAELNWVSSEILRIVPNGVEPIVKNVGNYKIFSEDQAYIEFIPCKEQNGCIYEGALILHNGVSNPQYEAVEKLFNAIKGFIRKDYVLSDDKTCYVGRDFMNCWLNRELSASYILQSKELKIKHKKPDREALINYIKEQGYVVSSICHNRKGCDIDADVLAFSVNEDDLIVSLNNRTLSISLDSNCVFMFRNEKYDSIVIDSRLYKENKSAVDVFDCLERYINKTYVYKGKYCIIE